MDWLLSRKNIELYVWRCAKGAVKGVSSLEQTSLTWPDCQNRPCSTYV